MLSGLLAIVGAAVCGSLVGWYIGAMHSARMRWELISLISVFYLKEKHMINFAKQYEAFMGQLPAGIDVPTRASRCSSFIQDYAAGLNRPEALRQIQMEMGMRDASNMPPPAMLFIGYSRARWEEIGRRDATSKP